ncbi:MAG: ribosome-associated translation inhibitor RaiA [Candidatus Solibacter sp.]|nr:ribosome-associated translation inhibitor RaiA [Candidatus Solibacter sp.]
MKITYTGRQVELAPAQLKKLEARFAKIGRLLDGKEERGAHVVLSLERKTHKAEATIHYYNHQLVGLGSSADLFTAIHLAAEKLEKQCVKARTKWRDAKRMPHKSAPEVETDKPAPAEADAEPGRQVYRVKPALKRKPMTVEEAVLEMDKTRDYLVYRDAQTDRVSVIVRRRDGHFDLVEG